MTRWSEQQLEHFTVSRKSKTAKLAVRERDILFAILEFLAARRVMAWRANTGAAKLSNADGAERFVRFGPKGQSDILGLLPPAGRMLAIECKAPGKKATTDQAAFLDAIRRNGGLAFVADNVDAAMVIVDEALQVGAISPASPPF